MKKGQRQVSALRRQLQRLMNFSPQQLERAQVVPHPGSNPTLRAALPGRPVMPPPVRSLPLAIAARTVPATSRPLAAANRQPRSAATRTPAPATGSLRTPAPRATSPRETPPIPRMPQYSVPPPFVTRATPPPPRVPFTVEQRSMLTHPGRPLEPQQIENLRFGRPPGPMLDREFPPHLAPAPRVRAPSPPVQARQRRH
jgi:hypothetical protein